MTPSELFKTAHRLTRSVVQSGENYRATFGMALRKAYLAAKAAVAPSVERIIAAGSVWAKAGRRRVYFNNLADFLGLEFTHCMGKVSFATFRGKKMETGMASAIFAGLKAAAIWFDLDTETWESRGLDEDYRNAIVAGIYAVA
ncbi:hypothetical protein [Aureimonas glaciei]|uniref:Uncharacterized protein n=1 Tax=Aureimonas glaciei TaxID=1776957 RepID=A0A916YBU0_9HYPH|nr:hypothetical protein [Aureimonas glaciei]GGD38306.1 hypothetical protein GCM10011335_46310 [Aureimonas glaciei]